MGKNFELNLRWVKDRKFGFPCQSRDIRCDRPLKSKNQKVILYIEDEEILRKLVRHSFMDRNYQIVEAEDGSQGVEMAERLKPDIILMDLQLPKISGYDAMIAIKKNPELKDIPIIALSGYSQSGEEEKAREAGCHHFITKPFDTLALVEIVDGLLAG